MSATDELLLQLLEERDYVSYETMESAREQILAKEEELRNIVEAGETLGETEGVTSQEEALIKTLYEMEAINGELALQLLSEELNMEIADFSEIRVDPEALELVPLAQARLYNVVPITIDGNELNVAVGNPADFDALDNLSHVIQRTINPMVALPKDIEIAINNNYDVGAEAEMEGFFGDLAGADLGDAQIGDDAAGASKEDAPIIKYVRLLITEAMDRRASDIHLEPMEKEFRVRYRIDGVLHKMESPPKRLQPAIVSRIKLMADINIAEKRVPLDGRINIKTPQKEIDLRVSTVPAAYGESIVMRILDKESLKLGLPQLGFFSDDQANFEHVIGMPDGIFLVTGPTGSGKSTTLYTALNCINKPDKKIITVEDPVEYELTGINQVGVKTDIGMTFSAALRAMLRQAPNIVMVGEIRDMETAEIAVNASLTGHMVFSTLHTNDATSSVTRLVDIGIKPFLVSAALRAALAQRLVRRICKKCTEPTTPDISDLRAIGIMENDTDNANFQIGTGCDNCSGNGFRGRMGVFEIFMVNEEMERMIYEGYSLVDIRKKAKELGMKTMREDGIRKVLAGQTTPNEVLLSTVADE